MLNIDWNGCKNPKAHELPYAQAVFLTSMSIAMGALTEKNIEEWERRAAILQAMDGPWLGAPGEDGKRVDIYLTREHLAPFVGMKTNVTPEATRSWNARMMKAAWRKVQEKAKRIMKDPASEILRRW